MSDKLAAATITTSNPLNKYKLKTGKISTLNSPGKDMLDSALNSRLSRVSTIGELQNYKQYKTEIGGSLSRKEFNSLKKLTNETSETTSGSGRNKSDITTGLFNATTDLVSSMILDKGLNTAFKEQQQIGNALMKANPIVGGIYKAASIVGELTNTNVSKMSELQAKEAGISNINRTLNNIASYIPGVGITGKTVDSEKSHVIDSMANSYGGSVNDINVANTMGKQNYLFGKNKANSFIRDSNDRNALLTDINLTNTLRKSSNYGNDLIQQNLNRYAGNNYMNVHVGKNGMKFSQLDEIKLILANRKQAESSNVEKFANGGLLEGENVLPVGKLHKELSHIAENNPELEGVITRKGIPVVAIDENGDLQAVAEIERDEICFSKALTDKIEDLLKDRSDEAMIEAGKILVEEILFNTKDEGGVINE